MCKNCKGKPYYITTAIAYTSRKPHIGNSYEIVLTDAIARYKRMLGYDVFFQTGTDEHGQKIEMYAQAEGCSPKEYVDKVAGEIRDICDVLNTSYDYFIRTTDEKHEKTVQKIFKKLYEQGDIYKGSYEGLYCTPCESFWTESQLVDGKCPDCGREVKAAKEEAYFLKLSKYQKQLEEYIESRPDFIYPEQRKKEMVNNFIKPGLQDLCVSRTSFKWGIPVDFDDKHVVYVWIDALSNYITALGYSPDGSSENYKKYWPADVHLIGKDIGGHGLHCRSIDLKVDKIFYGAYQIFNLLKSGVFKILDKVLGIDVFHLDCRIGLVSLHLKDFGNTDVLVLNLRGCYLFVGLINETLHITSVMCTLVDMQIIILMYDGNVATRMALNVKFHSLEAICIGL